MPELTTKSESRVFRGSTRPDGKSAVYVLAGGT